MNVLVNQLSRPARRIGRTSEGDDVFELTLKGGLVVVEAANAKTGKKKALGLGPHRALARHVAKMQEPGLQLTELSKSEAGLASYYAHLIPECVKLVERFRDIESR